MIDLSKFKAVNTSVEFIDGVVKVIKNKEILEDDEPTYALYENIDFNNGIIEVEVLSKLLKDAPDHARGFIGVAFRINDNKFECFYIRPTNSMCNIQIRRNRATQYFSYPDYKWFRLRKENVAEYESYSISKLDEWIKLRIEVDGEVARFYVGNMDEPSLIVNDLKHKSNLRGDVGLFVDIGTEGYFRNLNIIKNN